MTFVRSRSLFIATLGLTGATGLIYEVTWQKYLANFLGSEGKASALIVAVFLGGLALGYEFFGRISRGRSVRGLIRIAAGLELAIGVWALLFPSWSSLLWRHMAWWSGQGLALEILVAMLLIFLPTFMMGGTLPLLTPGLSSDLNEAGKVHAWIYSSNTAGGFLGCFLAGFFLLPQFGLPHTLYGCSVVNLAVGILWLAFARPAPQTLDKAGPKPKTSAGWLYHALAFLCGFIAITLQTALIRVVGLSMGSSEYSFALVVGIFIGLLAFGAYSVARIRSDWSSRVWKNQLIAAFGLLVLYLIVPYGPYGAHVIRSLLTSVAPNFYIYHFILFVSVSLGTWLALYAMGRSLPLLLASLAESLRTLGQDVGSLYFWNTIGCLLGAVVGGYLAYYVFDLEQVFRLELFLMFMSAGLALYLLNIRKTRMIWTCAGAAIMSLLILPHWNPQAFQIGTFRQRQAHAGTFKGASVFYKNLTENTSLIYRRDGPTSSVAVLDETNGNRSILINGKSDGSTGGDLKTVTLMAHVPALLTAAPLKDVAVIGFGTGITAGTLTLYPDVGAVHIFEMSPLVSEFAPFFDAYDHHLSQNGKVVWHLGDAYQQMLVDPARYALIASEPSNPWMTGVERLYTQEFLKLAAERLAPGGVYAQWFHDYDISLSTLGMVIHSFSSVFPEVRVFSITRGDILILGSRDQDWSGHLAALEQKWNLVAKDLERVQVFNPGGLLSHEVPIPSRFFERYDLHTLETPKLAYAAGYDFFLGLHSDLLELADQPSMASWEHRYGDQNLIELWLARHPEQLTQVKDALCVDLGQDSPRCQKFSTRLALAQNINIHDPVGTQVLNLLQAKPNHKPSVTASSPKLAEQALKLLTVIDSPQLSARKSVILELAKPCLNASSPEELSCRLQLVKSLSSIGDAQAAYAVYGELKRYGDQITGEERKLAIDAILEATKAY